MNPSTFAPTPAEVQPTLRVNALHALAYCPRLFYLEEVEQLYTQDAAVFAGRRLHEELAQEDGDWEALSLESAELGLRGTVDALRTRNGQTIPYEHKRGRCRRGVDQQPQAWESDRIQILAYACLIEQAQGIIILEGRIRYHADNVLVKVPVDEAARQEVFEAIDQARQLRQSLDRPPVTSNERLCTRCSLAPVCLPEETRFAQDSTHKPLRLFPEDDDREIIHVLDSGTRIGKSGDQIKIMPLEGTAKLLPAKQIGQLVVHGYAQITTQALHFCAEQQIGVHFLSGGGWYVGSFDARQGSIQRRIRQYKAFTDPNICLQLARQVVECKGQNQRKFLMRSLRGEACPELELAIAQMQRVLRQVPNADSLPSLVGLEGNIAKLYFGALPHVFSESVPEELRCTGRDKNPPGDRFNSLISYGYSLLRRDIANAVLAVGLEPALGFYHQPRSQAAPLPMDLMEIFRVIVVDMPILGSINRGQWDINQDFEPKGANAWFLSKEGKRKLIQIYERRKEETWKHPALGHSLTYRRLFELEVRLLEKDYTGEGRLFGQLVLR
jgi:CRISP-associated protein Cas1